MKSGKQELENEGSKKREVESEMQKVGSEKRESELRKAGIEVKRGSEKQEAKIGK